MKITTLINFSGGMDSTYTLYHWLKENPNEKILVHHINLLHKKEDRVDAEKKAVRNIFQYLRSKGLKNYEYHESSFDYGSLPRISVKDIQIVAFFTGIILKTPQWKDIDKILISWHKGEVDREDIRKGFKVKKMLKDGLMIDPLPEILFPIENLSREEMAENMPLELLKMAHSCRKPMYYRNCGICKTCKELKEAKLFNIVGTHR